MNSVKGIIFDYGGTIDTNGIHWGKVIWEQYVSAHIKISYEQFRMAYIHAERMLGKNPIIKPEDTFHTLLRKKIAIQADYIADNCGTKLSQAECSQIVEGCYNKVLDTLAITRNVVEQLSQRYPLVLVTNFYGNMPVVLEEFCLQKYFPHIIESSVVGIRKPDPALFGLGVQALGIAAHETLVVGDSYKKDIYPAHSLGCVTAWIKKEGWDNEAPQADALPDITTDGLERLIPILQLHSLKNIE